MIPADVINILAIPKFDFHIQTSEGQESRSRLGLETEGTETLGLVSVSYKIWELVSSRMKIF